MISTIIGYVLVGYLVSCFVSISYGVAMNRRTHEKFSKELVEKV